jgi:hypothetical protein
MMLERATKYRFLERRIAQDGLCDRTESVDIIKMIVESEK